MIDPFDTVNPAQDALREAIESAVNAATSEWALSYYDVAGVMHTYLLELHATIDSEADDQEPTP